MTKISEDEHAYYHVLRVALVSFMRGTPPTIAVEFARRAIPGHLRPSFKDAEAFIKNRAAEGGAARAAA
jgi:chemotaxis protein MotA